MNHSIYSADRTDPPQDRGRGPCRWYRGGRLRYLGADRFRRDLCPDARHQGRCAGRCHQLQRIGCALTGIYGIHAALYQPPKVATWIIKTPRPQVDSDDRKRPLPTGVFFFVQYASCPGRDAARSSCKRCFAEPGPRLSKQAGPRLCSAPLREGLRAALRPGNAKSIAYPPAARSRSACRRTPAPSPACRSANRLMVLP